MLKIQHLVHKTNNHDLHDPTLHLTLQAHPNLNNETTCNFQTVCLRDQKNLITIYDYFCVLFSGHWRVAVGDIFGA